MSRNETYNVDAPSKINLHLEILGRRNDGYHDLRSVFAAVNLTDRLRFAFGAPGEADHWGGLVAGVDDRTNTVVRAVELFRRETRMASSVAAALEKRIPLGAGLGGGSSDAAAALRLCNRAAGFPLDDDDLVALGAEIGSDVPFFLKATCAVVEGRGELVAPLPCPRIPAIVLLVPEFSVNTAEAYRRYDEAPRDSRPPGISREMIVRSFPTASPADWDFFNSFSPVLTKRFELYGALETRLKQAEALFTGISGSGSSFFGVFDDRRKAEACLPTIEGRFRFAGVVEPLRELPPVRGG